MSDGENININNRKAGSIMEDEQIFVTLELEDGREVEFEVVLIFEVEDKEYAALTPVNAPYDDEYSLFRVQSIGEDEYEILNIEDDEEYEIAEDAFSEILDTEEWNGIFDEEEE